MRITTLRPHEISAISVYAAIIGSLAAPSFAQTVSGEPQIVSELRQCQGVTDSAARLACYDRGMAAFSAAQSSGELAVIDRAQVRETRRQLFGFEAPDLGRIFNMPSSGQDEQIDSIETTLVSAQRGASGRWQFVLADGSRWRQTSNDQHAVINREGDPVRIRRASLGSYLMSVGRSRGIRVERQ